MRNWRIWLLLCGLFSASMAFAGPADDRHALMKANDAAMQALMRYAVGATTPYDGEAVRAELQGIRSRIETFVTLFPEGSEGGRAGRAIWTDKANFNATAAALAATVDKALAAAPASPKDLIGVVLPVEQACKACHDAYRD